MKKFNPAVLVDPLYEPFDMLVDHDLYKKISKTYFELLSTFELRRSSWQLQSGLLFEAYPGCTHTRRAHAIGCWILGWHSLMDVKVLIPDSDHMDGVAISLKNWLKSEEEEEDFTMEYLLSLLLHDLGHGPFSHALESNPFLDINHEEIGRSLICNDPAKNGINYHILLKYLLSVYKIKKTLHYVDVKEYKKLYKKAKKETRLVYDILKNSRAVKINVMGSILKGEKNDPRLYILNRLVDSEIDIDRIDHFLRDSYYSGIKFADYRVKGLFQNLVIVPKNTKKYEKINKNIRKKIEDLKNIKEEIPKKIEDLKDAPAYLMVKEEGIEQVEYLLTAREFIFDRVLFHPKNLMLIGALNMGVRLIAQYEPCITTILPFLTDQILLQMFREDKFANTTIGGYEKILRGEITIEEFSSSKEILLKADNREEVKEIFEILEDFNSMSPAHPKIIMFSNSKRRDENDNGWKNVISEKNNLPLGMSDDEKDLFKWLRNKEENRSNKVIIWYTKGLNLEKDIKLPKDFLRRIVHE